MLAAVPGADWQDVSRTFVEHLGLTWNPLTTQIESHDWQAELYADVARFNRVLRRAARKGQLRRWIRALRSLTAKLNLTVRRRRLSQALAGQGNAMHAG